MAEKTNGFGEWRRKHGLSREAVADAAGVTGQTVDNWEHDKGAPKSRQLAELVKLAPGLLVALGIVEARR